MKADTKPTRSPYIVRRIGEDELPGSGWWYSRFTFKDRRLTPCVVTSLFLAGESVEQIVHGYAVTPAQIRAGVRWCEKHCDQQGDVCVNVPDDDGEI